MSNINLENPATTTELRFFLGLLFQYVIGILIARGYLDPSVRDQLVSNLVDFTGYIIILITSAIGLFHLFKTSRKITSGNGTTTNVTKVEVTQQTPAAGAAPSLPAPQAPQTPAINAGTPLSPASIVSEVETFLNNKQ